MWDIHPSESLKETLIAEFAARHDRCIATDGTYSDAEMFAILSNLIKSSYEEDLKWIRRVFDEIFEAGRLRERHRVRALLEENKVSDTVVYEHGLPPADILPDMLRDIDIARNATNGTLDAILKAIG